MKHFPVFGGSFDGKVVALEWPYGQFAIEEDGKVRTGPSNGERHDIRSINVFGDTYFFAVHESLWHENPLETWVGGLCKMDRLRMGA
jgi:hypothetical protein